MMYAMIRHCAILITKVAMLSMIAATPVCADIVSFVNPAFGEEGHFDWTWQRRFEDESPLNWLDITKTSTDQGRLGNTNSVGQLFSGGGKSWDNATFGGALVARVGETVLTKALIFGEAVHKQGVFNTDAIYYGDWDPFESDFEESVPAYIGVMTGDGNYGWIEVIRGIEGETREFVAIAWAYETIPGKPIYAGQIPAPSALALLGGLLLISKSRKRINQNKTEIN